eukprot:gene26579-32634_t
MSVKTAFQSGDCKALKKLFKDEGASANFYTDNGCNFTDWTGLMQAVAEGDEKMTRLLLKAGASVNHITREGGGKTVLHIAAERTELKSYQALIELLISYGANPAGPEDNEGWAPCDRAMLRRPYNMKGNLSMLKLAVSVGGVGSAAHP